LRRIAICTPDVDSGDAVSNDAVGMFQAFTEYGYEAKIIAVHARIPWPEVHKLNEVKNIIEDSQDILIYHHSVGWEEGIDFLRNLKCIKIIKYHNVTPPTFFEGIADNYLVACQSGRSQLRDIVDIQADLYLGDSSYNVNELLNVGKNNLKWAVLPPFHHIDRLQLLEPEKVVIDRFKDGTTNVLTVGRIAPNKGHLALIDAFYVYHQEYNPDSRLIIVGKMDPGLGSYNNLLRAKVEQLQLENNVFFTGAVTDSFLKGCYAVADVFVMTSLHEGFCVPLVEAMSMKIPIVAYGSTAIPETVGRVGLVWEECDPQLLAASIDKIVQDESLRLTLGEMGWNRYTSTFTNNEIGITFLEALNHLL